MRIKRHPILTFERGREITFDFEGRKIKAYEGESIAASLHAAGIRVLSESLRFHRPRGFFCAIGKCSSCLMEVDGVPNVRTCIEPVRPGIKVRRQKGGIGRINIEVEKKIHQKPELETVKTDIAVVGGGPAGLSAAIYGAKYGARIVVVEENPRLGGQLIKQTHKFFGSHSQFASVRGIEIAERLSGEIPGDKVDIITHSSVVGYFPEEKTLIAYGEGKLIKIVPERLIVATGAQENFLPFEGNDLPGVYGAGAIQTLMNVYGIIPGNKVLMVGAGNIGVIVSYQLLQAGVKVAAIVEAMPKIGAYQVHASKVARAGVPIYTRHTIKKAIGKEKVEGAVIVALDEKWNEVSGTEQELEVDTICLAIGLTPSTELLSQAGCEMRYIPELGGPVPWHDEDLETSVSGIYVAGDASGIDEASTAMLEGRLTGVAAAEDLFGATKTTRKEKEEIIRALDELREGPFGERVRIGKQKLLTGGAR